MLIIPRLFSPAQTLLMDGHEWASPITSISRIFCGRSRKTPYACQNSPTVSLSMPGNHSNSTFRSLSSPLSMSKKRSDARGRHRSRLTVIMPASPALFHVSDTPAWLPHSQCVQRDKRSPTPMLWPPRFHRIEGTYRSVR